MSRTITTTCDNCGKELDAADGWHLALEPWFVQPSKRNPMTLEAITYPKPISEKSFFCDRLCLMQYIKLEWERP